MCIKTITINLYSLTKNIKTYTNFLKTILVKLNVRYQIINLPIKTKKITLLKSPHVNKKAREQFEVNRTKTIIKIETNRKELVKFLILNKPKFIKITIKTT
jgi:small subunit ribosomal protein S10